MAEHLDADLYNYYKSLATGGRSSLEKLRNVPDLEREKKKFIGSEFRENPNLTPEIDVEQLEARRIGLTLLASFVEKSEDLDPIVKEAYVPKIAAGLVGCRLLLAAAMGDVDGFIEANEELYNEPVQELFNYSIGFFDEYARSLQNSASPYVKEAALEATDIIPSVKPTAKEVWPSGGEFKGVRDLFSEFYSEMFEGIHLPRLINSKQADSIINKVLLNLGFDYKTVPQKKGISTMSTSSSKKEIKIPADQIYDTLRFKGLVAHEIRIHVEEAEKGSRQPLRLLGVGLRGSLFAGEGKGLLVEQLAYKSLADFFETERFIDILRRHVAIGLTRGLDGNGDRDFKSVFRIVNAIDRVWELDHNPNNPQFAIKRSIDRSWELLSKRTNKEPSGKGSAHYKDKIYLEGNVSQWKLLIQHPNAYKYLNLGHYDLTNPQHVTILRKLKVIPKNVSVAQPSEILR